MIERRSKPLKLIQTGMVEVPYQASAVLEDVCEPLLVARVPEDSMV